ncbi:hypothetical protein K439DRAFT_1619789 [Ramaria rubella]|nr:hypothetical protein K439DRAFT_1619789 [Ramaria rubella]
MPQSTSIPFPTSKLYFNSCTWASLYGNLLAIDYMRNYPKAFRAIVLQTFATLVEEKTKLYSILSILSINNTVNKSLLKLPAQKCSHNVLAQLRSLQCRAIEQDTRLLGQVQREDEYSSRGPDEQCGAEWPSLSQFFLSSFEQIAGNKLYINKSY